MEAIIFDSKGDDVFRIERLQKIRDDRSRPICMPDVVCALAAVGFTFTL